MLYTPLALITENYLRDVAQVSGGLGSSLDTEVRGLRPRSLDAIMARASSALVRRIGARGGGANLEGGEASRVVRVEVGGMFRRGDQRLIRGVVAIVNVGFVLQDRALPAVIDTAMRLVHFGHIKAFGRSIVELCTTLQLLTKCW